MNVWHKTDTIDSTLSLQIGDVTLFLHPPISNGEIWQSIVVSSGVWKKRDTAICCTEWPKEAAALLHNIASELERAHYA